MRRRKRVRGWAVLAALAIFALLLLLGERERPPEPLIDLEQAVPRPLLVIT